MNTLQQLEQHLEDAKTLIDVRQRAMRLAQNTDFRKLILEGFCLTDAARLVQQSGDPAMGAEERADALAMAQASGHLKRYLSAAIRMGDHSERTLGELQEAIEEARAEGGAE